jgi:filamentous hemagglutinin family protein
VWRGLLATLYAPSLCLLTASSGVAQIVPDNTLPINSTVTSKNNTSIVNGGTTAGGNLFHSFERFGVSTDAIAVFNNAPGIENIISRVTGRSLSNINGEIRANGTANLFLLNPNGIIFGPNARLNIGGSFFASTAQSLKFADGKQFGTTNLQSSPLLIVSVPVGLQYGVNPGSIVNRSRASDRNGNIIGLQVPTGKTLGLIGDRVVLEGGHLSAPQGRIELGSVGNNSFVSLTPIDAGFALGYEGVRNFQDINLSQQASVNASGEGGGNIRVWGGNIALTESSSIVADTLGSLDGGAINIEAKNFRVEDGAFVAAGTFGSGAAGDLTVRASESMEIAGFGFENFQQVFVLGAFNGTLSPSTRQNGLFGGTANIGSAGDIAIDTPKLLLRDGAIIAASTFGDGKGGNLIVNAFDSIELMGSALTSSSIAGGDAGNITIDTGQLILSGGGFISVSTISEGAGGNLLLKADKSVELLGSPPVALLGTTIAAASFGGTGAGGDITIETGQLSILDGGQISTTSGAFSNGASIVGGRGGNLTVTARTVEIAGISPDGRYRSRMGTDAVSTAPAGELRLETGKLIVRDGGQVGATTSGEGAGGSIAIRASESIELIGTTSDGLSPSGLFASAGDVFFNPLTTGTAGDLKINTDELIVRDGAAIGVNSLGSGNAGTLEIVADSIRLDDRGKLIATTTSGEGGNINLQVRDILQLRNNSLISAEAGGTGNGGNIKIDSKFIVAVPQENSDIIANAFQGRGGNINITTQGIFGLESREKLTSLSDITASSEFGLDGTVQISSPDVDPSRGLVELPSVLGVSKPLQGCQDRGGRSQSRFVNIGRGGLPSSPTEPLSSNDIWEDLQLPTQWEENSEATATGDRIIEAQGWLVNERGQVVLAAQGSPQASFGCKITQSDSGNNSESTNGSGTTQP